MINSRLFRSMLAAAAVAGFAWASPATAAFSSFLSLGADVVLPDPSCASDKPGFAVCATRGLDGSMYVNRYDGAAWGGWQKLRGVIASSPSCTAVGSGKVICGSRSAGGALSVTYFKGSSWSSQRLFGGGLTSAPSCASHRPAYALCVARSQTGGLTWNTTTGLVATDFSDVPGTATSAPRCASDNAANVKKNVICTYANQDGHIYTRRFDGVTVTAIADIGGQTAKETPCTNLGPGVVGKVFCAAVDPGSSTFLNTFNGGAFTAANWSGFTSGGGSASSFVSCAAVSSNSLACGAIAVANASLYVIQTGSSYQLIGGAWQGGPSCFNLNVNKVMCVMVGIDGVAKSTVGP